MFSHVNIGEKIGKEPDSFYQKTCGGDPEDLGDRPRAGSSTARSGKLGDLLETLYVARGGPCRSSTQPKQRIFRITDLYKARIHVNDAI